ncbi:hypothetical protein ACLOJK_026714 [Asimina triloba]
MAGSHTVAISIFSNAGRAATGCRSTTIFLDDEQRTIRRAAPSICQLQQQIQQRRQAAHRRQFPITTTSDDGVSVQRQRSTLSDSTPPPQRAIAATPLQTNDITDSSSRRRNLKSQQLNGDPDPASNGRNQRHSSSIFDNNKVGHVRSSQQIRLGSKATHWASMVVRAPNPSNNATTSDHHTITSNNFGRPLAKFPNRESSKLKPRGTSVNC